MEEVYSSIARFIDDTCGDESETGTRIKRLKCSQSLKSQQSLDSLLCLIQSLNKVALKLSTVVPDSNSNQTSELESAILSIVNECISKSDEHLHRAMDELLNKPELFKHAHDSRSLSILKDATNIMADAQPKHPSVVYTPRAPRLPGLPEPPPDSFGEWDEYRDDLDPGYRVRDVYEYDYYQEQQPHQEDQDCVHIGRSGEDELFTQSSIVEPSPVPIAAPICAPDDDELARATSAFETISLPPTSSRSHSPFFGHLSESSKTLKYDYMGNFKEVDHPLVEHRLDQPIAIVKSLPPSIRQSIYPVGHLDELLLPIIHEPGKTGFEISKEFDSSVGVLVAGRYRITGFLGSAAFSKAVKAIDTMNDSAEVCLKIIKNEKDFFDQSLDEIKVLSLVNWSLNVEENKLLKLYDFFYFKEHLILVTELLRENMYEFGKFVRNPDNNQPPFFTVGILQKIAHQLLTGIQAVHSLGLIHCDLKPENVLFKSFTDCDIRIIDFGSSCFMSDRLSSYVQSRCYRAPEVILGCMPYSNKIDMWSIGCILAEIWTGTVLFQNDSSQSLLARVIGIIGKIPNHMIEKGKNVDKFFIDRKNQELFVEIDSATAVPSKGRLVQLLVPKKTNLFQRMRIQDEMFLDFLAQLLQIDPDLRMSAADALMHPWICESKYSDGI